MYRDLCNILPSDLVRIIMEYSNDYENMFPPSFKCTVKEESLYQKRGLNMIVGMNGVECRFHWCCLEILMQLRRIHKDYLIIREDQNGMLCRRSGSGIITIIDPR